MSIGFIDYFEIFQNIILTYVKCNFGVFRFVIGVYSIETPNRGKEMSGTRAPLFG